MIPRLTPSEKAVHTMNPCPRTRGKTPAPIWLLLLILMVGGALPASAQISTSATQYLLKDLSTNQILSEKNSEEKMYPASLTKLMVVYVAFDKIQKGELDLDAVYTVSALARAQRGSRMFLEVNSSVTVEDLLRGIIVQSGNDATIALAEGMFGSVEEFVVVMNEYANNLNLFSTRYTNTNGWPHDPKHYTTAVDTAELVERTITDFPELYALYREREFTYNNIRQENRNPLLFRKIGADGLKTGNTDESGYSLAGSALFGDRRLVVVVSGLKSKRDRAVASERLLRMGASDWTPVPVLKRDKVIAQIPVFLGDQRYIAAGVKQDIVLSLTEKDRESLETYIAFEKPLRAPVMAGQTIGTVHFIDAAGNELRTVELIALTGSENQSSIGRIIASLGYIFTGIWHGK